MRYVLASLFILTHNLQAQDEIPDAPIVLRADTQVEYFMGAAPYRFRLVRGPVNEDIYLQYAGR